MTHPTSFRSVPLVRVAIPCPLFQTFDYLPPSHLTADALPRGARVQVPFGRGKAVGVVTEHIATSSLPLEKLKAITALLDDTPLLDDGLLALAQWAANYYHYPLGEVLSALLPPLARRGMGAASKTVTLWRLTPAGVDAADSAALPARAARQAQVLAALRAAHPNAMTAEQLAAAGIARAALRGTVEKQWVEAFEIAAPDAPDNDIAGATVPTLTASQQTAINAIEAARDRGFQTWLLEGITGSGKTEVYLRLIESTLARGQQVLVLVPEIGLTPQLVGRFRARLAAPLVALHSGLADRERLDAWLNARSGAAPVVIGTRLAVFTPLPNLGLIVVDEEHDASFKQQDSFRYHARDVAIVRAKQRNIPIILGSATPSLETLWNAQQGRYQHARLPDRAGNAVLPTLQLVDIRGQKLREGIAAPVLNEMRRHLADGNQVLLFLNRRGYAPVLLCHDCGWVGVCPHCDARLTLHLTAGQLRCHHCDLRQRIPERCPSCASAELIAVGKGTERVDRAVREVFPDATIARIDRDTTQRKGALEALLDTARRGDAQILIGTQMLAKGHDFPNVTLVCILDADSALFSVDFRAGERLAQLITQVGGRAGRADKRGMVLIQTHHPDHALLRALTSAGYPGFAQNALAERREAALPPFCNLALLRADSAQEKTAHEFLHAAAALARGFDCSGVELLGPIAAPMGKRAGRHRAHLLLQAERRNDLHRVLTPLAMRLNELPYARKVRWSLDVDPVELS